MTPNHLHYWLAALYLPDVGPRTFLRWLDYFPDIEALFRASSDELFAAGVAAKHLSALRQPDWKSVEKDLLWAQVSNQHIVTLTDEDYPYLLKETIAPPLLLYVQGNKQALSQAQIAIVGSRHASHIGLKNAERFAFSLAEAGFVITSGLALGVDAASHHGALAGKGLTIGVAGTGLDHIYPSSNGKLVKAILQNQGAIISEFPLFVAPLAANFPRRNRIISGLSLGVLVVEAALKSGSLVTARHALEQGREVFAVPGSIHNPLTRGCHHLIRQGAKLVETVMDIIEEISSLQAAKNLPAIKLSSGPSQQQEAFFPTDMSQAHRQIFNLIEYEITPMNVILSRSRLTSGEVSSILLALELNGYIQSVPGGYVRSTVMKER